MPRVVGRSTAAPWLGTQLSDYVVVKVRREVTDVSNSGQMDDPPSDLTMQTDTLQ